MAPILLPTNCPSSSPVHKARVATLGGRFFRWDGEQTTGEWLEGVAGSVTAMDADSECFVWGSSDGKIAFCRLEQDCQFGQVEELCMPNMKMIRPKCVRLSRYSQNALKDVRSMTDIPPVRSMDNLSVMTPPTSTRGIKSSSSSLRAQIQSLNVTSHGLILKSFVCVSADNVMRRIEEQEGGLWESETSDLSSYGPVVAIGCLRWSREGAKSGCEWVVATKNNELLFTNVQLKVVKRERLQNLHEWDESEICSLDSGFDDGTEVSRGGALIVVGMEKPSSLNFRSSSLGGLILLLVYEAGKLRELGRIRGLFSSVTCVSTSLDQTWIAAGDNNARIFVWERKDLDSLLKPTQEVEAKSRFGPMVGHTSRVTGMSWGSQGGQPVLASTSLDRRLCLWTMKKGSDPVKLMDVHKCSGGTEVHVVASEAVGSENHIITSGDDGCIKIHSLEVHTVPVTLQQPVQTPQPVQTKSAPTVQAHSRRNERSKR
eukprot:Filipodium_phascolosomae@DN860_c0_g1_i1.p1